MLAIFEVYFFVNKKGKAPLLEYMDALESSGSKDARIKLNAIKRSIYNLSVSGTLLPEPHLKYLGDGLWELRPIRDRIIFVTWSDSGFMLLHHFMKTTQKTPKRELDTALANLKILRERGDI